MQWQHICTREDLVAGSGVAALINGELVVASPLYKQHFSLLTGVCLEQDHVSVPVWEVKLDGDKVLMRPLPAALNRTGT